MKGVFSLFFYMKTFYSPLKTITEDSHNIKDMILIVLGTW